MKSSLTILFQSFVKPFYKENAGAFVFIFTMMFFIVSTVDGAGLLAYHYSLVTSLLTSYEVMLIVFFLWLLYVRKFTGYVVDVIQNPQYRFLYIINNLTKAKRLLLFYTIVVALFMPVLLYTLFIVYVAVHQHLYVPLCYVVVFLFVLSAISTYRLVVMMENAESKEQKNINAIGNKINWLNTYPAILLRYVMAEHKFVWLGTKLYTCGVLYLIARNNKPADYDTIVAFLFFNFGVYANAVWVYNIRQWEEQYASFYRSLPVALAKRFSNYLLLYFVLLLPEFFTILLLTPVHLTTTDALLFSLNAYSLLLLMNSLLFLWDAGTKEIAVILVVFFCLQYLLLLTTGYLMFPLICLLLSVLFFTNAYYRFEKIPQKESA